MTIKSVLLIFTTMILAMPVHGDPPALVLQITVDQLRGDMPLRFRERFGEGGLRYFLEQGTVYGNAHFRHANTTTAAGHATLATGGNTREHGIAGNDWWDREKQEVVYCVEDADSPILGSAPGKSGRSPRNLQSSTFGDQLVLASGGRSRVFSVSTKDRSAVLMAGHSGKAYWYSKASGEYVSSTWYHERYPQWLSDWNAQKPADRWAGWQWTLVQEKDQYLFSDQGERTWVRPRGSLGQVFPHTLEKDRPKSFYSALRYSPAADLLTLDVVKTLISAEKIGQGGPTDFLSVSFSATDYIGHAFGPNSLEAEDNLLHFDRSLAELLQFVDEHIGLENTLMVLSADHGITPAPEVTALHGHDASRVGMNAVTESLNRSLMERFNTEQRLVSKFLKPGIYLDPSAVSSLGISLSEVELAVVEELLGFDGIGMAYSGSRLAAGLMFSGPLKNSVMAAYHPARSGDVMLFPKPFWYLSDEPNNDAATHGAPYTQDTHVPVIFAGHGVSRQLIHRRVAPRDIAPTLSALLNTQPPSGSTGQVLHEVLP